MIPRKAKGDGDSDTKKYGPAPLPDAVRDKKKSSTPMTGPLIRVEMTKIQKTSNKHK